MNNVHKYGAVLIIALLFVVTFIGGMNSFHIMSMDHKRGVFISLKEDMQHENMKNHDYRCCLEKPCTYCLEKTPGHGEGSTCDCLKDLIDGVHPCGECIGEIMEGHGNPYLSEYFARAIAEKVGEEHKPTLMKIMEQKYGIPIQDQI
jgi:hypothetical protein